MKTVAAGAHYTTITVDTAEAVKFSFPSTSLSVEASGGDITVALTDTAQAGDDETITVPDGESRMFIHHRMNVDTYYLTGSGTAKLYASNMGDVNPFKGKSKGGDGGGDNTHYKGTTTTPLENGSTTNPITIDGESYTAVFGDVVVYGYTEFVFDGAQWSEFGRPFDTTPTAGSTNAVTSDGIYKKTPFVRAGAGATLGNSSASGEYAVAIGHASSATKRDTFAAGYYAAATGDYSSAFGFNARAAGIYAHVVGKNNRFNSGDLFEIGNGYDVSHTSNIVEVSNTQLNVNGDIEINNVAIPTPYTTMPTITEGMLGKIAMYVGATGNGYTQGCFYIAATDGAAEPTYSWVQIGGTLGMEEVVLWAISNYEEAASSPMTSVTLSESIINFDELYIEVGGVEKTSAGTIAIEATTHTIQTNQIIYPSVLYKTHTFDTDSKYFNVRFISDTEAIGVGSQNRGFLKIIGRRYTRISPTGYRQAVLWENTGTTNPDTITLSEAWSNFDEMIVITTQDRGDTAQYETAKHTSVMAIGGTYTMWYNSETAWGTYSATSSTVFTKVSAGGVYYISKIIGIKY